MGFLIDIFFGTDSTDSVPKKKPNNSGWTPLEDDYDNYYEQIYDDAMCGDLDAIDEEFGDDWEEYIVPVMYNKYVYKETVLALKMCKNYKNNI